MIRRPLRSVSPAIFPAVIVLLLLPWIDSAPVAGSPRAGSAAEPQARIAAPISDAQLVRLRGNVPSLARPEFDRGPAADSTPMTRMLLLLEPSTAQEAALQILLAEQQIKGSPAYHHWLTPAEFGQEFGLAAADLVKITRWLASRGFSGIQVEPGRNLIEFSGNVSEVNGAFHTAIDKYVVQGKPYQSNASEPSIPAALAPVVAGIVSLNDFPRLSYLRLRGVFERTTAGRIVPELTTSRGCGAAGSQPCYAVSPADFATIYNSKPLFTALGATAPGQGYRIAVVEDSNINPTDLYDFRSLFGLPPRSMPCPAGATPANGSCIIVSGPDPGVNGDEGEADLDAEWSGGVAPGATIDVVVSQDTLTAFGGDLSAMYIVNSNADDILSVSYGACESALGATGNQFYNQLWQQAAAQGITVVVATGDSGSAGCDNPGAEREASSGLAVSGAASSPFDTAAGGTDFDDAGTQTNYWSSTNSSLSAGQLTLTYGSAQGYIPETTWNDSCAASATASDLTTCASNAQLSLTAGSGGASGVYTKPPFQVQSGLTPNDGVRDVPDISFFASVGSASNSFYAFCEADAISSASAPSCSPNSSGQFSFVGAGGTSFAAPAFAGVMAIVDQGMGGRQGAANPILYKIAHGESYGSCNSSSFGLAGGPSACPLNDITKGNISVPCTGGTPNCSSSTSSTTGLLVSGSPAAPAWTTGTGYDLATGLGSIDIANLAAAWPAAAGTFTGTSTSLAYNGPATFTHGSPESFVATVSSSGSGTPTGAVALLADVGGVTVPIPGSPGLVASLSGSSPDTAAIGASALPGGTYTVYARYGGDVTFSPSRSTEIPITVTKENSGLQMGIVTFGVNPATGQTTITSTNASSIAYGSNYILEMDVLNQNGAQKPASCQPLVSGGAITGCATDATGTISLTDNGSSASPNGGAFGVNTQGQAENQPIQLLAGTQALSANYSGDASYNASSATDTVTVSKAATSTAVTSNLSSVTSGGSVTLTATVSSSSNSAAGPSGTVQFQNDGSNLGGAVTCIPTGASTIAGAFCTATLTTSISQLPHGWLEAPRREVPPGALLAGAALALLLALLLGFAFRAERRGYPYLAGLSLVLLMALGTFGCGGGGGSKQTTTTSASITGQYSGDSNYAASTSPAIAIAVQK